MSSSTKTLTEGAVVTSASEAGRDRSLDGFRAVAVLGVIAGHALAYRYTDAVESNGMLLHQIGRLAGSFADTGVYIFFAISGYIITTLMLREEAREGRFSLAAFYVRRSLRILPPFAAFLAALALLAANRLIEFQPAQIINAAAFSCNTGLTECSWYIAHTWSLAVEEQYYLVWPLLFTLIAPPKRHQFAAVTTLLLITAFVLLPWDWHSNTVSFACIAAGATCALQPHWREALERVGGVWSWSFAVLFALLGPLLVGLRVVEAVMPALAVFLLFGGRRIRLLRRVLESAPLQLIGAMSYSLYLWQQLFLAAPTRYSMEPPPVWLLPIAAWLSLVVIERPCIRLAHRLSRGIMQRRSARHALASAG